MKALAGLIPVFALAGAAMAEPAPAPQPPQRIQGTIEDLTGPAVMVKSADGKSITVTLQPDARVLANQKISFGDIKANDFVTTTGSAGPDGKMRAEELRVLPEEMRGMGEGQYPSIKAGRDAINAAVTQVSPAAKGKGGSLKVTFHGSTVTPSGGCVGHASAPGKGNCIGQAEITVGPKVPVTQWVLGDSSWLEKGKAVSCYVVSGSDGQLSTHGLIVEHNSAKPLP